MTEIDLCLRWGDKYFNKRDVVHIETYDNEVFEGTIGDIGNYTFNDLDINSNAIRLDNWKMGGREYNFNSKFVLVEEIEFIKKIDDEPALNLDV